MCVCVCVCYVVCVCVCVCVLVCDVICQNGDREEPSWRRQYVSLDVCTQKTPSLCLKDRTVPQTARKEEAGNMNPTEVRTLAIICEPRDNAYSVTSGTGDNHNTQFVRQPKA